MNKAPSYFRIPGEKRQLNGKELFSFLREKVQPEEVIVCGEPMAFFKLPEFISVKPKGLWEGMKNKLYRMLLNRKMEKLLAVTTEEFPLAVLEACLAEFLKKECAFRRATKVLIADKSRVDFKELLMPYCSSLNYLEFLVDDSEAYEYLAEEMYEESGLTVTFTVSKEESRTTVWEDEAAGKERAGSLEKNQEESEKGENSRAQVWSREMGERYHIVIDVRNDFQIPVEYLAEGCVYFDALSDEVKEKYLRREGKGITYISPGIYLDRALKSTV
ncbi:MAG: hypothetical protein HDT41_00825 [Lachnospiraceae bacterium]|nr:hypothetical protein [Lachnospiraceae bacterium]